MKVRFLSLLSAIILLAISGFVIPSPVFAAGSMYLSPGSKIVGSGSIFYVSVRENSGGDAVNAVQANLSYPADKIDFISISTGGSAFSIDAPSGGGGGSVNISRGLIGDGVSGDKLIATVAFRAKASYTGPVTITIAGGSSLLRGSDQANVLSGTAGANYTVSKNIPTQAPAPGPTISSIKVDDVTYNSATITWTTATPATSQVDYGISTSYGLTAQSTTLTTNHSITLTSDFLTPGTKYHFKVKSADSKKNESQGTDMTFTTKGYTVTVSFQDSSGRTLSNTQVQLSTQTTTLTATTDTNGQATFADVPDGKLIVNVSKGNSTSTDVIQVKATPEPQNFTVKVKGMSMAIPTPSPLMLSIIGIVLLLLIVIILYRSYRKKHPSSGSPTVILRDKPDNY